MSKSNNGMKKKFKLSSTWIFLIVVVAAIAAIYLGNRVVTYANKSGGQRVFEQYIVSASSQDVEGMAKTLFKKGSDEYNEFVAAYKEGKEAYAEFLDTYDATSDEYKAFITKPIDMTDPIDLGLLLEVEQRLAKNIEGYEYSLQREEDYYDEFNVLLTIKSNYVSADFPEKVQSLIEDKPSPFEVKFSSASGEWLFLSSFSLLEKLGEINTWATPFKTADGQEGVELKYLNPVDLEDFDTDAGTIKQFDTTKLFNGEKILSIGSNAFEDCAGMQRVVLNNDIVKIGNYAFKDCKELVEVVYESNEINDIDRNITVGEGAFYGCEKLKSFVLPKINKIIPDYVFYNCASMTSYEISSEVSAIGHYAFALKGNAMVMAITNTSYGLSRVNIGENIVAIGDGVFMGQANLSDITYVDGETTVNRLSENLIRLGSFVFNGCASLTTVELPNSLTKIEQATFQDCTKLANVVFPENLRVIGASAFASTALGVVDMPKSVEEIGVSAFAGVTSLSIVRWDTDTRIRVIGASAFKGCSEMYEFTLPKTIRQVGAEAFASCAKLRVVRINCAGNISIMPDSFEYSNSIPKVYVENTANYKGDNWNHLEIYPNSIINDDFALVSNGDGTNSLVQFLGGKDVSSVDLDAYNITRIGSGAFAYSQYIKNVTFTSEKIVSIGDNAFVGSNVEFTQIKSNDGDTLSYLGGWLINANGPSVSGTATKYSGTNLDLRTTNNTSGFSGLPQTVGIASGVFYLVSNLRTVYLPSSLVYIGENAFRNSANITTVQFQGTSHLKEIGASAFENCVGITNIDLPQTLNSIGARAFFNCDAMRFVFVNNIEGTTLGANVFTSKQDNLKIYISGLNSDGSAYADNEQWATYGEFTFDKSIINGDFALIDNGNETASLVQYLGLKSEDEEDIVDLTKGASVNVAIDRIYAGAFATSNIDKVVIPYTVTEIGNYAFFKCSQLESVMMKANGGVSALNRIGEFAFSQTNLGSEDGEFIVEANEPNETFTMGNGVFDNISRIITVGVRANYIANNYWRNYVNSLAAIDDPVVNIKIELEGTAHPDQIRGNRVGRVDVANTFKVEAGAPNEELRFTAVADVGNGFRFVGWFVVDSASGVRGSEPISTESNYVVTLGEAGDEQFVIAVFERYATVVNLGYRTGSTSAMGTISFTSTSEIIELSDGTKLVALKDANGNDAVITLNAEAKGSNSFAGWFVDGGELQSQNNLQVTLVEDITIEALFG